jgi:hypothetical protein
MTRRHSRNLNEDLRIGVKVGLLLAASCSFFATVAYLANGREAFVARVHVGLPTALAVYFIGGLAGGLIIGLLRPLRSTAIGSFVIGTLSSIPLLLVIIAVAFPRSGWYPLGAISLAITAVAVGGGLGAYLHSITKGWAD